MTRNTRHWLGTLFLCFGLAPCTVAAAPDADALATGAELGAMKANTPPAQVYDTWNRFCQAHFGAEKEPLVRDLCGQTLEMVEGGTWVHVSQTSACIAWETNLPALTHVEYGPAGGPDARTAEPERHFYVHVHYLTDLQPNTRYR
ncbi:MAG: fibronectin type III domain-containing protein, partial [Armatimonadota bacterium]